MSETLFDSVAFTVPDGATATVEALQEVVRHSVESY
jgi:hypothetical protein